MIYAKSEQLNMTGGHIAVADAAEGLGDLAGALNSYVKAWELFDQHHPDADEPRLYVIQKIRQLRAKLGDAVR